MEIKHTYEQPMEQRRKQKGSQKNIFRQSKIKT